MGEVESKKGGRWGFWGAAGGSGWQGRSRNEKNLAAAHCALVMRSMCRRGARLLISGGSRAFHARLVIGPEGAFIPGDSNCEGSAGRGGGASGKEGGMKPPSLPPTPPGSNAAAATVAESQMNVLAKTAGSELWRFPGWPPGAAPLLGRRSGKRSRSFT